MLGLWKSARAGRIATRTIVPFVETTRQRLGTIPAEAWQDPYVIGFIGMLITLIAGTVTNASDSDDGLALAQLAAWSDITGVRDGLVGEDMCRLSLDDNPLFASGCENAHNFLNVLAGVPNFSAQEHADILHEEATRSALPHFLQPEQAAAFGSGGLLAASMWAKYFDERIPSPTFSQLKRH